MTAPASGSRYPQLRDLAWWRQHGSLSNIAISEMLGAGRETVRLARRDIGIAALPRGRARGATIRAATTHTLESIEDILVARISRERRKLSATEDLLVARLRAAHEARAAGDDPAYDDALLGVSSAAALIVDHRRKLRAA
jgi:hypothetical protein